jgi:hypothetical protein
MITLLLSTGSKETVLPKSSVAVPPAMVVRVFALTLPFTPVVLIYLMLRPNPIKSPISSGNSI